MIEPPERVIGDGPSNSAQTSAIVKVYTTPALHGDRISFGAPAREGVLQTLTGADFGVWPLSGGSSAAKLVSRSAKSVSTKQN